MNNGFCLEVVMVLNIVCLLRVLWITKRIMGNIVVESLGRMNKFWFTSWKFLRSLFGLWLKVCLREGMGWILYGDYDISSMVLYV